jgi:predicted glycogen debranching enzyme
MDTNALGDIDQALTREWLVTNGVGGYAMGSVAGATTRVYHGYLIAAPNVPQERIALVTQLNETATLASGAMLPLSVCERASGGFDPQGYSYLAGFALDGLIPCFIYQLAPGQTLEKRVWMEHGADITYVRYRHIANGQPSPAAIQLRIEPYCVWRDHHASQHGSPDWRFAVEPLAAPQDTAPNGCLIRARPDALACRIGGGAARFEPTGEWRWGVAHRAERERGLDAEEDVYIPGAFTFTLLPGASASLILSAGDQAPAFPAGATPGGASHEAIVEAALQREQARQRELLRQADKPQSDAVRRLTLAADQFIVGRRPQPAQAPGIAADPAVTIIAGYPWFTDWGRDTMIALPGLMLATGRYAEARGLLRGFVGFMSQGMIPNRFPDSAGAPPEYNTVDATLWLFHALDRYLEATGDWQLLTDLFPALDSVIDWHVRGARYGIHVDAADGLLHAGAEGVQLTWMDAKVDDWVVTPRRGKPVEISALWYHALTLMSGWARRLERDASDAVVYDALAAQAKASFAARFWYPAGGYLYDVVDVDGQRGRLDWSLRPNQVLALAIAPELVTQEQGRSALLAVERALLTPLGLRTLAPSDPNFQGRYGGDRRSRDAAYHQGTVWPWLIGPYADARAHFFPEEEEAGATRAMLLAPIEASLSEAGIGTISEIASGAPPFTLAGCPAQAWSVAESLRLVRER